jgi:hypothetical protein
MAAAGVVPLDYPRTRQAALGDELRRAARAYLQGRDSELEEALRACLALLEGKRRGLP